MSTPGPRGESQPAQYGRRRSNTAQSILRPNSPLGFGDSKVLNSWVHDPKESATVIFNQSFWPGVAEGDILRVLGTNSDDASSGFLFTVPKDEGCLKPLLQISIPKPIADTFGLRNNGEVTLTKVDSNECGADYVEFVFQDQYLGRNDMWRLGEHLVGQCVYTEQEITFVGSIVAKIQTIYINGQKVSSACMTSSTKAIYRSLSAKVTIFIQVCRELWEFAGDGERYNEKIVHSFLPTLFAKWREAGTNHTLTIVFISRVYYEQSEIDYAAGPLRCDEEGNWYKDFYKVITDLEVRYEWKPTLVSLKDSFWDFQRDILLTHHYHRGSLDSTFGPAEPVRLVGRLSFAHDGPILEALNLALNPTETHYIDRSLSLTGATTLVITPGTGYYRVSKQLLRLTTTRMLDQGFGVDLISLAKPPLHQTPIFQFQGVDPELKMDKEGKPSSRAMDPLWGGDDDPNDPIGKSSFWWEPFWISVSFWDKQMDLPFREDRFIARAKMHEIQMLGLLEHDVISSIEIPFLPAKVDPNSTPPCDVFDDKPLSKEDADKFDLDIFTLKTEVKSLNASRVSFPSSGSGTLMASSYRSSTDKWSTTSHRTSIMTTRIPPIEESPGRIILDLPSEGPSNDLPIMSSGLSTSPSQSSLRSLRSVRSNLSLSSTSSKLLGRRSRESNSSRSSLASKLTPSWLFNPFRSEPSEPQTSRVLASASSIVTTKKASSPTASPIRMPSVSKPIVTQSNITRTAMPVAIKNTPAPRSNLSRTSDDDSFVSQRSSYIRSSPINTPPRDESTFSKRRTSTVASFTTQLTSSSPVLRPYPFQPQFSVSSAQSSLARRWQHIFPQIVYKHDIKWKSIVTPGCLPLTVEYFPTAAELESSYDVFSYDFVVDPSEMRSFLVKPPAVTKGNADAVRRAWALVVMRGMAAVRLAQGFQFVLRPHKAAKAEDNKGLPRSKTFMAEEDLTPKPAGAAEVLRSTTDPVYLSMSNEIHCISYTGEAIQVRRYVRRMPPARPFEYQCLIWPKLGGGYTELSTKFTSYGLENYGWNRLDMLVAGYEHQFNESLRYWRTRFVVIPTTDSLSLNIGQSGEKLNNEETRILGIERLAEQFSKLRWQSPEEKSTLVEPVRFLPTTLDPALCVLDEGLMEQLDQIHAAGPLRKKMKSEKEIADLSLAAVAKAMREDDGVPIKYYQWHRSQYPNSFTGFDFVSWLVREFRDVSSRAQGTEWGIKLQTQGLFEHCKGTHGFLDGHYFYQLKGEYAVPMTPRGWFRSRQAPGEDANGRPGHSHQSSITGLKNSSPRRNKRRLILSQSMVIDIDPNKRSDQAESVILHHDIIHNPATVFHFELQWIGTTPRLIEDLLRQWSRTIERYGLKLVEAYVTQISDIRDRNPFQSCFPIPLAVRPPVVPDLEKRIPNGMQTAQYFEYTLLRRFGFVLDVEGERVYPEQVDVVYSYRRSPFKYTQFVHRSGVACAQVLNNSKGFLFLTNRLIGHERMGGMLKSRDSRPAAAEEIRVKLHTMCMDSKALTSFYEEELAQLGHVPEEPPPLSI